ncbi:hypothetical protein [Streptomyces sp. XD-27]|uniref:hypothetical protein n=1 Tax=Streptomyces sp. XD-27 TaxID=3062779 RepID=UPI0026F47745|nr:hypothetical protein [Streptomyces sp. XD-27]WKX70054.1 hypothetical protein Q3Y56_09140 [Streptomyces sp. XD-27]
MTVSRYRVLLCDLRTDRVLAALPLHDVSLDDYIGKAGSLQGTVPVPNRQIADRIRPHLIPGRTAVWVERDRSVWWGGVLWTAEPTIDDRGFVTVPIQAGTFDTYLEHRILWTTQKATQVDQFGIVRDLIDYVQSLPGGDIGIEYDTAPSGVARSRTFSRHDQPRIRELLDELAKAEGGFEWRIACLRDPETGRRTKQLQLGHPIIDRSEAPVVLNHPGHILAASFPIDATVQANVWQARGATTNSNQAAESKPLTSELLVDEDALADGWPRLDGTADYSSTNKQAELDEYARADFDAARHPRVIPAVTVRLGEHITPDLLGRTVRIRIRNAWFPDGYDERRRVVGIAVTPPERGKAETAKLTLETPTHGNSPL